MHVADMHAVTSMHYVAGKVTLHIYTGSGESKNMYMYTELYSSLSIYIGPLMMYVLNCIYHRIEHIL